MSEALAQFPAWLVVAGLVAIAFSAVAHGAIGFGFPLLSTPLIALMTDVRTAIVVTVLPNIVLNVLSVVRGADWRASLARYWPMAVWVLVGTLVGTRLLARGDARILKALLAVMIVVYLLQSALQAGDALANWLRRHPRSGQALAGLLGGFFSGTVNVAVPPLLIYFSALSLPALTMTQALNLSFLTGRATQALSLAADGHIDLGVLLLSLPLTLLAVAGLRVGFVVQRRLSAAVLNAILRAVMWAMAAALAGQAAAGFVPGLVAGLVARIT